MNLKFTGKDFVCECRFQERMAPRQAGFLWDPSRKAWYTKSRGIASRLIQFASEEAKREIHKALLTATEWKEAVPHHEDKRPKDYQLTAARWALARNRSYLALDPGLGKTICAALILNALQRAGGVRAIYVAPPFLCEDAASKIKAWALFLDLVHIRADDAKKGIHNVMFIPDSILTVSDTRQTVRNFTSGGCETVLIVDEAHRYKTGEAARSRALFDFFTPRFDRIIFMSGTPMPNRPIELFPMLNACAPELIEFRNFFEYGIKYCAGFKSEYGWDFTGASNTDELFTNIKRNFMLRMTQADVLPELDPVIEEAVVIDQALEPTIVDLERELFHTFGAEDLVGTELGAPHMATYRRLLGLAKVKIAAEYVKFVLESGDESVLLFTHHPEVHEALLTALSQFKPLSISAKVKPEDRLKVARRFQESETDRLLISGIATGGVGLDLTKASRVIFSEFSWCPADNDQAVKRAHRIGQTNRVCAQFLVHKNSMDRRVMETILRKKETIKKL